MRYILSKVFTISIKENRKLSEEHYILTVAPSEQILEPLPGQFFMVAVGCGIDPLLKRPFSIHRWLGGEFQIMYRVVGRATALLKAKVPGDVLNVVGPFGNGFPVTENGRRLPLLIAGGIGVAPLFPLAEALLDVKPVCFYGARTGSAILCSEDLKSLGVELVISTDDGTAGRRGTVVDLMDEFLSAKTRSSDAFCLYACGPRPMLRSISQLAERYDLKGFMALEERMACGFGSCLGCVVNTRSGYKRVCKEGPVFPLEDIVW